LDRVGEIENEIKQDFTNDGPFHSKSKDSLRVWTKARGEKELKVWRCKYKQKSGWNLRALLCLPFSLLMLLALLLQQLIGPIKPENLANFVTVSLDQQKNIAGNTCLQTKLIYLTTHNTILTTRSDL